MEEHCYCYGSDIWCRRCRPMYMEALERIREENRYLQAERRRRLRRYGPTEIMYADVHNNQLAQQQNDFIVVEGGTIVPGLQGAPVEWRMVYRKPSMAFEGHFEGEGELSRERRLKQHAKPLTFTAAIPDWVRPQGVDEYVARQLHSERMARVEPEFRPPTPGEKGKKRRKRRDPLFTSVHYPGDNPRK